jgi:hypothetical protein
MAGANMSESLAPVSPFSLEPLEIRQLLSVSLDANGWTMVGASPDTHRIYVSSALGNDENDGLSPSTPVQTLAQGKSLLRDGSPDWLLLRRGDTWNESLGSWKKSGRSADEPMLISAYGSASSRPIIKTGDLNGIYAQNEPVNYLSIIGLHFYASSRDPLSPDFTGSPDVMGIRWLVESKGLLIEDTKVEGYSTNIFISPELSGPISDVSIRRSTVVDSYSTIGHSAGALLGGIDGVTLEGNVFDHNGWNELVEGAEATFYNHNVYLVQDNKNVVVRDNIFANASSHGLQARSGGIIVKNLFINNPIGMSFGLVNGSSETPGGVSGRIDNNVFVGSRDINGQNRSCAIEIGNTSPGGNTTIYNNVFFGDDNTNAPAIQLSYGKTGPLPSGGVGINDLTIEKNVIYGWGQALYTNANLIPGSVGFTALNGLVVRGNDFQRTTDTQIITHLGVFDPAYEQFSGNRYYAVSNSSSWFSINRVDTSFNLWRAGIEPTASGKLISYRDPTRSVATYNATLGGTAYTEDFLLAARMQAKFNWSEGYTAHAADAYLHDGFFVDGDVNMDGSVTIADFITLAAHFGQAEQDWSTGDLNGDGLVSIADLIDLASNFNVL